MTVHRVAQEDQEAARNEQFHRYLRKVEKVNSYEKYYLHQWLHGLLFIIYDWNSGLVDGTDIYWYFVALGRELPFTIELRTRPEVPRY